MFKKLALLIPSLRNLHQERNQYAQDVEYLNNHIENLKENNLSLKNDVVLLRAELEKQKLASSTLIKNELNSLNNKLEEFNAQISGFEFKVDSSFDDLRKEQYAFRAGNIRIGCDFHVYTNDPIAYASDDHVYPRGTRNDNTRYPRFVRAAELTLDKKQLKVLDLGCAGGGMVLDFLLANHMAIGIEGSDYSAVWKRAEWGTIPGHLFTADITKPFRISSKEVAEEFDLITAWEVLEHINEEELTGLFDNIRKHLSTDGIFCGSVATFEDSDASTGAIYHVTIKSYDWWVNRIVNEGFEIVEGLFTIADFPRGSGNPRAMDWNAKTNPELGFHICFRKKTTGNNK